MEKRLEIKLPAEVVGPMFDVLLPLAREEDELAIDPRLRRIDAEFRELWTDDLKDALKSDCARFLEVFDREEFRETGVTDFSDRQVDPLLRACSALRLKLRTAELGKVSDDTLEDGEVDFAKLKPRERMAFTGYVFLGTLQEILIRHLDVLAAAPDTGEDLDEAPDADDDAEDFDDGDDEENDGDDDRRDKDTPF